MNSIYLGGNKLFPVIEYKVIATLAEFNTKLANGEINEDWIVLIEDQPALYVKGKIVNGYVSKDMFVALDGEVDAVAAGIAAINGKLGAANGIATLDANKKVPTSQLPDAALNSLTLGETSTTAYAGSKGKAVTDALANHKADKANPHGVTKTQVGLGNVDNTSDADKPISTAAQEAIDAVDTLIDNHIANKSNPHGVTKSQVGLGSVTNDAQVKRSEMGVASGVATLGSDGKVPAAQLPSYVDDVLEAANQAAFPATGEEGKIYVAKDTNKTFRWSGSGYVEISASLALGETASTAYAGSKGKATTDKVNKITNINYSITGVTTSADNVILNGTSTNINNNEAAANNTTIAAASTTKAGVMSSADKTKLNKSIISTEITEIKVVAALPDSPSANTLYLVISE